MNNCKFCGTHIVHDGKHWAEIIYAGGMATEVEDFQDLQRRRTCQKAPTIVRFHTPDVSDAALRSQSESVVTDSPITDP